MRVRRWRNRARNPVPSQRLSLARTLAVYTSDRVHQFAIGNAIQRIEAEPFAVAPARSLPAHQAVGWNIDAANARGTLARWRAVSGSTWRCGIRSRESKPSHSPSPARSLPARQAVGWKIDAAIAREALVQSRAVLSATCDVESGSQLDPCQRIRRLAGKSTSRMRVRRWRDRVRSPVQPQRFSLARTLAVYTSDRVHQFAIGNAIQRIEAEPFAVAPARSLPAHQDR